MRNARIVITVAATSLVLAACGGDVDVSPRAERELQAQFDQITAAVAAFDRVDARSAIRQLERSVAELVDAGLVSDARAAEILSAAEEVAAQLSLLPAPEPTESPSPEPTESPSPSPTDKPEKPDKPPKGEAHGHDEDHGHGND